MVELASEDSQLRINSAQPELIPDEMVETVASKTGHTMHLNSGLLITFEGGEGSGKTTQSTRLAGRITELGIDVVHAREPGGTGLGEHIRSLVKRDGDIAVGTETLLFAAARAQLVKEVIQPKLRQRAIVILDRFTDSTLAYQGFGRGLNIDEIMALNRFATGGIEPELTVLLDADPAKTLRRVELTDGPAPEQRESKARAGDRADERRFEKEPLSFHEKVRKGYLELSKNGTRWSVIRADQAQHRVADAIWKRVRPLLVARGVDESLLKRKQGQQSE